MSEEYFIGIDLGTTYSSISVCINGVTQVIEIGSIFRVPSCISFLDYKKRQVKIGFSALNGNGSFVCNIKKLLGRQFSSFSKGEIKSFPFEIISDEDDEIQVKVPFYKTIPDDISNTKVVIVETFDTFYPEELLALVLNYLCKAAMSRLHLTDLNEVVIAVPVMFGDVEREALYRCASLCNIKVKKLVNESVVALMCYSNRFQSQISDKSKVCVIEMGGGKFDISLCVTINKTIQVLANGGDKHFGGDDFTQVVSKLIIDLIRNVSSDVADKLSNIHIENKEHWTATKSKFWYLSQQVKESLSANDMVEVYISDISDEYIKDNEDFSVIITKQMYEGCEDFKTLISHFKKCIFQVIKPQSVKLVDHVLLIGGGAKNRILRQCVETLFGKQKVSEESFDELNAVVNGAALYNFKMCSGIDNDVMLDVLPVYLGFCVNSNKFDCFAEAGKNLPIVTEKVYKTTYDGQTQATFEIYSGTQKSYFVDDMDFVTKVTLKGFPKKKSGDISFRISIEVDNSARIKVYGEVVGDETEEKILLETKLQIEEKDKKVEMMKEHMRKYLM
ncbi:heat shock 70 kDa protein, putative [Entamoeba invadens IP1]|uniref:Heat shock 70 kDa protein, putative n=1 Tax=Entamoeba invadens IP1 TaxID=370355 RepID=A0A0A1UCI0_ENTIV|nr:heat shock 70 kDa protein, putative [Entamoeba invadens IP1]ELP92865.1 heat shock 70 kDa protein, putative [Entamoeba invadens IP1]|eukprot:XP_004259636.1 heat shock 70 kDa protein, putative [Entamoeba invadens IP1]